MNFRFRHTRTHFCGAWLTGSWRTTAKPWILYLNKKLTLPDLGLLRTNMTLVGLLCSLCSLTRKIPLKNIFVTIDLLHLVLLSDSHYYNLYFFKLIKKHKLYISMRRIKKIEQSESLGSYTYHHF